MVIVDVEPHCAAICVCVCKCVFHSGTWAFGNTPFNSRWWWWEIVPTTSTTRTSADEFILFEHGSRRHDGGLVGWRKERGEDRMERCHWTSYDVCLFLASCTNQITGWQWHPKSEQDRRTVIRHTLHVSVPLEGTRHNASGLDLYRVEGETIVAGLRAVTLSDRVRSLNGLHVTYIHMSLDSVDMICIYDTSEPARLLSIERLACLFATTMISINPTPSRLPTVSRVSQEPSTP
jgi:hypothetical protein